MKDNTLETLFSTVIDGGYCSGCGACASVPDSPVKMALDNYGRLQPIQESDVLSKNSDLLSVCPFSDESKNEDQIGEELFGQDCVYHDRIGYHLSTYAAHVTEGKFREHGSSGGMGTWILKELFDQKLINKVVHVQQSFPDDKDKKLFRFSISNSISEICRGAKSRYYPVEMSEVITQIREEPGHYAIVGVPCFIKAIRLLSQQDPILNSRIIFCVGLVCGHLKTTQFSEMFAWQCGVKPGNLKSIDFRKKIPGKNANRYGIEVIGDQDGHEVQCTKLNSDFFGSIWGHGFFKYQACDYCDDVVAETADITVGDAWLPPYLKDSNGTNIVIVRNLIIQRIIDKGIQEKKIQVDSISAADVAQSQDAGLRHRREGLAYRLHLKDQEGQWRPQKRVMPKKMVFRKRFQETHRLRILMSQQSHIVFLEAAKSDNFYIFKDKMSSLINTYKKARQRNIVQKAISKLGSYFQSFRKVF